MQVLYFKTCFKKTILILSYILVSILAVKLVAVVVPWRELEKRKVVF